MKQPFELLEAEIADWMGYRPEQVVCCSSGTAAVHLALEALQLPPGSEVITGDFNMVAVPRAIVLAGLTPMFVDCDERLLMDVRMTREASYATPRLHTVVATHIYGRQVDMEYLHNYLRSENTFVVEDMAELHGVRPHGGTDAACWSFYRNKVVHGEEGGAVAFKNPDHATLARQLRCLGFTSAHDFDHVPRGHNYRMSNLHAEPIRSNLQEVEANLEQRREVEEWYDAACLPEWRMPPRDSVWVYDVRVPGLTRQRQRCVVARLVEAGIMARMSFLPMSAQREFKGCRTTSTAEAYSASEDVFYLPCDPGTVTEASCRRAFEVVREALMETRE